MSASTADYFEEKEVREGVMKPAREGVQLREKWDQGSVLAKDPARCLQHGHAALWVLLMVAICDTAASLLRAPFLPLKGPPSPAGYGMHTCACVCVQMCLPVSLCGGAALGSPSQAVNFSGRKCLHLLPEAKEFLKTNSPILVPKS